MCGTERQDGHGLIPVDEIIEEGLSMIKLLLVVMLGLVVYIGLQPADPEALRQARQQQHESEVRLGAAKKRFGRAIEDTCRLFGGNCSEKLTPPIP
jgi:hypothetical protein